MATDKWGALGRNSLQRRWHLGLRVYVQVGQQTIADYGAGIAASTPRYRYVYASYIDEPVLRYDLQPPKRFITIATNHTASSR